MIKYLFSFSVDTPFQKSKAVRKISLFTKEVVAVVFNDDIEKESALGNKQLKKSRKEALAVLPDCKCAVQQKLQAGHVWLTKDKTSKLVPPEKVQQCLEQGWHKSKTC